MSEYNPPISKELEKWSFILDADRDVTDLTPEERMSECILIEPQEQRICGENLDEQSTNN